MALNQEYPTIAAVKRADVQLLRSWDDQLPAPQTDVEHTVKRRIEKRLFELAAKDCREKAPDVADAWNDLMDCLESVFGKDTPRM